MYLGSPLMVMPDDFKIKDYVPGPTISFPFVA